MKKELIKQAEILFDAPDKWVSFNELKVISDELVNVWTKKMSEAVTGHFANSDSWDFALISEWDIRWFLPGYDKNSCSIVLEGHEFYLWINNEIYDYKKVMELVSTKKFQPLRDAFQRLDKATSGYIFRETGNWHFKDGLNNGSYESSDLAWYFGNRTDEFIEQLVKKIDRFNNDNVKGLIREINDITKRKR